MFSSGCERQKKIIFIVAKKRHIIAASAKTLISVMQEDVKRGK
jgi:hypothetical protein